MNARDATRYHYTVGFWARLIIEEGVIRPTDLHVGPGEKPAVWFSTNPTWESSANKARNGEIGMTATARCGRGIYRFAVAPETAPHNWETYVRASGVSPHGERQLRRGAKKMYSNHREYFVSFDPVPREKWVSIERFDFELSRWLPVDPGNLQALNLPSLEVAWKLKALRGQSAAADPNAISAS